MIYGVLPGSLTLCNNRVTLSLQLFKISLGTELQYSHIVSHLLGIFVANCMQTNLMMTTWCPHRHRIITHHGVLEICIFVHWLPHLMSASCDPWLILGYLRCPYRIHTFQTRPTGQVTPLTQPRTHCIGLLTSNTVRMFISCTTKCCCH